MIHPIHHTFGPHVTWKYYFRSVALLLQPWKWKNGKASGKLKSELGEYFRGEAFLFASGRESLLALFRALNFSSSTEVVIQGYTCVALPNAIHAAGLTTVYADCSEKDLNFTVETLEKSCSPRTRAVICQHTFGIPAEIENIRTFCTEKNIILIEDLAHSIPQKTVNAPGMFGDYVMLSFGRDKAISGIAGGAIVSRNAHTTAALLEEERHATHLPSSVIFRLLLYPATYLKSRLVYGVLSIGKVILTLAKKLHTLIPILTPEEKRGYMSPQLHNMPNACAALALSEWKHLQNINAHRIELTTYYHAKAIEQGWKYPEAITDDLPLQKFPLYVPHAEDLRLALKTYGIFLEDGWTGAVVCPRTVDQTATNYAGNCPIAERVSQEILCLPAHPTMTKKKAETLIKLLSDLSPSFR